MFSDKPNFTMPILYAAILNADTIEQRLCMAQQVSILLVDDIDGSEAVETV
jgi:hypothetical protein